jgi:hypothetical protein
MATARIPLLARNPPLTEVDSFRSDIATGVFISGEAILNIRVPLLRNVLAQFAALMRAVSSLDSGSGCLAPEPLCVPVSRLACAGRQLHLFLDALGEFLDHLGLTDYVHRQRVLIGLVHFFFQIGG